MLWGDRSKLDLETDVPRIKESILTTFSGSFTGLYYLQMTSVVSPILAVMLENLFVLKKPWTMIFRGVLDLFTMDALPLLIIITVQFILNAMIRYLVTAQKLQRLMVLFNVIGGSVVFTKGLSTATLNGLTTFLLCLLYVDSFIYNMNKSLEDKRPNSIKVQTRLNVIALKIILSLVLICLCWELVFLPERDLLAQEDELTWKVRIGKVLLLNCASAMMITAVSCVQKSLWLPFSTAADTFNWLNFESISDFWFALTPNMHLFSEKGIKDSFADLGFSQGTANTIAAFSVGLIYQWIYAQLCAYTYLPILILSALIQRFASSRIERLIKRHEFFTKSTFFLCFFTFVSSLLVYSPSK